MGKNKPADSESALSSGKARVVDAPVDESAAWPDAEIPRSRLRAANVSTVPHAVPLRYPGGKTWLVPHILEWLKTTRPSILIEPFAGGGIVSLTAVMDGLVERAIMVELDREVAAFWHAARHQGNALAKRVLV